MVFRGTRVPAQTLLDYRRDGYSLEEFLEFFPTVQREDADELLRLAVEADSESAFSESDAVVGGAIRPV